MIWDKAQELGRMIGQSPEYQALRRAETSLRDDRETVARLEEIQTLARKVEQEVQGTFKDGEAEGVGHGRVVGGGASGIVSASASEMRGG